MYLIICRCLNLALGKFQNAIFVHIHPFFLSTEIYDMYSYLSYQTIFEVGLYEAKSKILPGIKGENSSLFFVKFN